jgi:hypothetical protein
VSAHTSSEDGNVSASDPNETFGRLARRAKCEYPMVAGIERQNLRLFPSTQLRRLKCFDWP